MKFDKAQFINLVTTSGIRLDITTVRFEKNVQYPCMINVVIASSDFDESLHDVRYTLGVVTESDLSHHQVCESIGDLMSNAVAAILMTKMKPDVVWEGISDNTSYDPDHMQHYTLEGNTEFLVDPSFIWMFVTS